MLGLECFTCVPVRSWRLLEQDIRWLLILDVLRSVLSRWSLAAVWGVRVKQRHRHGHWRPRPLVVCLVEELIMCLGLEVGLWDWWCCCCNIRSKKTVIILTITISQRRGCRSMSSTSTSGLISSPDIDSIVDVCRIAGHVSSRWLTVVIVVVGNFSHDWMSISASGMICLTFNLIIQSCFCISLILLKSTVVFCLL